MPKPKPTTESATESASGPRPEPARPIPFLTGTVEEIPINTLLPHPRNPNTGDTASIRDSISRNGFYGSVIAQRSTNYILVGNHRWRELRNLGSHTCPVQYIDCDDETALRILLVDNRSGRLGSDDLATLTDLLASLSTTSRKLSGTGYQSSDLQSLLDRMSERALSSPPPTPTPPPLPSPESFEPEASAYSGIFTYREDVTFPSTNRYGIPDLLPDRLSTQIPMHVYTGDQITDPSTTLCLYGSHKFPIEQSAGAVLGFFVDDERFEVVWREAVASLDKFKAQQWSSLLCPDFSLWRNWPVALQIYNTYRRLWCARYWQEAGFPIIPTLNWSDENSYDFTFLGVPKNAPLVAAQCRTLRDEKGRALYLLGMATAVEMLEPQRILIYGGTEHEWLRSRLPRGPEYFMLDSWTRIQHEARRQREKK